MGPASIGGPARFIPPSVVTPSIFGSTVVAPFGAPRPSSVLYSTRKLDANISTFAPSAIVTPNKQVIGINPINPVTSDGKPIGASLAIATPVRFGMGTF